MTPQQDRITRVLTRIDGTKPGSALPKHLKMCTSPFVMFRGAAALFYDDLATGLLPLPSQSQQLPDTTVMGDCHISNFGFFSEEGSYGERVIFAPNDFDDACLGNPLWDLMRYISSLALAVDHCHGAFMGTYPQAEPITKKTVTSSEVKPAAEQFITTYIATCEQLLAQELDYQSVLAVFPDQHLLAKPLAKAQRRSVGGSDFAFKSTLAKAVDLAEQPLRFRDLPEKFTRLSTEEYAAVAEQFAPYVDDQIIDIVTRKGAGTGSVNMQRYYLLVGPADTASFESWHLYHLVEVKKQRVAAPLQEFTQHPNNRLNPAHLTVACQRRMQANPDLVLDEVLWRGEHWLVRSRHHAKVGIDPDQIASGKRARSGGLADYAASCAKTLALAHARGDRRSHRFEQAVVEQLPAAKNALIRHALNYAEQVKKDWQWLCKQEGLHN